MTDVELERFLCTVFPNDNVRNVFKLSLKDMVFAKGGVMNYVWYGSGKNGKTLMALVVKKILGCRAFDYQPHVDYPPNSVVFTEYADKDMYTYLNIKRLNEANIRVISIQNTLFPFLPDNGCMLIPFETHFTENPQDEHERPIQTSLVSQVDAIATLLEKVMKRLK